LLGKELLAMRDQVIRRELCAAEACDRVVKATDFNPGESGALFQRFRAGAFGAISRQSERASSREGLSPYLAIEMRM
jgi:hypothetical protein